MTDLNSCLRLLRTELQAVETLIALGNEKQECLLENNVAQLNEVVAKEEKAAAEFSEKERLRVTEFAQLAQRLNLKPEASFREIALLLPITERNPLLSICNKLTFAVKTLKQLNKENTMLLNQSLDLIRFSLKCITTAHDPTGYSQDGEQKQAVSMLLDKKV